MDLSNLNYHNEQGGYDDVKLPVFHEEDGSSSASSASSSYGDVMRELNRMKAELKKYQATQAAESQISAIGSSPKLNPSLRPQTSSNQSSRVQVSKEEFDYCFSNRLCLKCKKPNHRAAECRGKYQPLK